MDKKYIAVIDKTIGKESRQGKPLSHEPKLILHIPITIDEPDTHMTRNAWRIELIKRINAALAEEGITYYSLEDVYEQISWRPIE